jgi:hypothetical protein
MTGMTAQIFCLKYIFGMPKSALQMYIQDDSGFHDRPLPNSNVSSENRVDYLTHLSLLKFTSGNRLTGFYNRWRSLWISKLQALSVGKDWVEMPDLLKFFEKEFGSTVIEAACGPLLERINPEFTNDLALYERHTSSLSKGFPRWLAPEAHAVRDKLLGNIQMWHSIARTIFDKSKISSDGDYDPFWGSEFMRSRQDLFQGFSGFDARAAAASDLGFIWA